MAKITQLYKNSEPPKESMKEYNLKLLRHRAGIGLRILLCAAVVLGIVFGMWVWSKNKTYMGYEILGSIERADALNTMYAQYGDKILKYNRDGISCVDVKNEAVWSHTYNMQTPILDVCEKAIVVADYQGNEVYVFGEQGLKTQITTLLPIDQVSVSAQGVTALLLSDSETSWIYLYDAEGQPLADGRCSLEETGQPLSISISSDGAKLAVSYLQVRAGAASSCIVFYNFGPVGGNFVDKIVASKVYDGVLIPRIQYLGDSVCAAVSEESIIYYEGKEIPEEKVNIPETEKILSVFFGESAVGIVTGGGERTERYEIHLYDINGEPLWSLGSNLPYSRVQMSGTDVILHTENECEIYGEQGVLRYTGTFDGALLDVYKGSGLRKYILVFSDRTEEIKLK